MPARRPPTARRPRQLSLMLQPRWAAAHGLSPQACSETITRASLGPEAGEKCGWPQPVAHLVSHLRPVSACAQAPPPGRKGPPRWPCRFPETPAPAHLRASPSRVFEETERHLAEAEERGTKRKSALARPPELHREQLVSSPRPIKIASQGFVIQIADKSHHRPHPRGFPFHSHDPFGVEEGLARGGGGVHFSTERVCFS